MRKIPCVLMLLTCETFLPAQDAEPQNLADALRLTQQGQQFLQRRQLAEAAQRLEQALTILRKVYPEDKYPNGHDNLSGCLSLSGIVAQNQGKYVQAQAYYEEALAIDHKQYPKAQYPEGHIDLALSLNNVAAVMQAQGAYEQAEPYYEQALAMTRRWYADPKAFPNGHPDVVGTLNNLATLLTHQGSFDRAQARYEEAAAMARKLYPEATHPDGHFDLARNHNNLGHLFKLRGAYEQARSHYEQALRMQQKLYSKEKYPSGHPELALSLNNLGILLMTLGEHPQARLHLEKALEMERTFYPEARYPFGHPALAGCLSNLGLFLKVQGAHEQALSYFEKALAMRQTLYPKSKYPNGHPDLATSMSNLASVLNTLGRTESARTLAEQTVAMYRTLYPAATYPAGQRDLASSLSNLGSLLMDQGAFEPAQTAQDEAWRMRRKFYPEAKYPDGHSDLVLSSNNFGFLMLGQRSYESARKHFEEALAMNRRLVRPRILAASETAALTVLQSQPLTRDGYLTAVAQLPDTASDAYRAVWDSKYAVTRVLELRQATARAGGTKATDRLARLQESRRRIEQLLQETRLKPEVRDKELARRADERDALERDLAEDLPILKQWDERDQRTPTDLAKALPAGSAFVDFLAYIRFVPSRGANETIEQRRVPSYLAFVVARGQPVHRIDLGPAGPIDNAVRDWRKAIDGREPSAAAESLRARVWEPLAKHVPPGTTTLYLAPDGDLARLPWAALPIARDRILLEDYTVATIPHGPYLLEQLVNPPKYAGPEAVLGLGDVTYGLPAWPPLPGTRAEISVLASGAGAAPVTLTKTDATAARLTAALPTARYAHLATHGAFLADELAAEKKRERESLTGWQEGTTTENRRVAAKNPLGFVGLVLAKGEVLTGLGLMDLPLENLKLVTLSACETGLGELTGGEGVQGLQRAFHLAGCPNVVASLWNVNDAATAALMTKFYHELWVNKRPPIEALREAQLTIYRHPELIPDLAGERGAPRLKEAVAVRAGAPATGHRKHADTRLWAAFGLSGVGK